MTEARIPKELEPYFNVCFILGFGICSGCGREQPFTSNHPQFSDGWWLDEARAMRDAGWSVLEAEKAFCASCSEDPNRRVTSQR